MAKAHLAELTYFSQAKVIAHWPHAEWPLKNKDLRVVLEKITE